MPQVPAINWSAFYRTTRWLIPSVNGFLVVHSSLLAEAILRRYLPEQRLVRSAHEFLADYFASAAVSHRVVIELPFQLLHSSRPHGMIGALVCRPAVLIELKRSVFGHDLHSLLSLLHSQCDFAQLFLDQAAKDDAVRNVRKVTHGQVRLTRALRAKIAFDTGAALHDLGLLEHAKALLRISVAIQRELDLVDPSELQQFSATLRTLAQVATAEWGRADLAEERLRLLNEALASYQEAVGLLQSIFGENAAEVVEVEAELGLVHQRRADFEIAESMLRKSLENWTRLVGPSNVLAADLKASIAAILFARQNLLEAEVYAQDCLDVRIRVHGPSSPSAAEARCNLGAIKVELSKTAEANALFEEAVRALKVVRGTNHEETKWARSFLEKADMSL